MASTLSSIPSGMMGICMFFISSGLSIIKLIWAYLGALHCAARWPSLLHLKHLHGGHLLGCSACMAFLYAHWPYCLGVCAWLLMSTGTAMSFIHRGALDELTCCGAKF